MKKLVKSLLIMPLAFSMFTAQAAIETSYKVTVHQKAPAKDTAASIIGAIGAGAVIGVLMYNYPELFREMIFGWQSAHHHHYCCDRFRILNTVIHNCYPCYESNQITIRW